MPKYRSERMGDYNLSIACFSSKWKLAPTTGKEQSQQSAPKILGHCKTSMSTVFRNKAVAKRRAKVNSSAQEKHLNVLGLHSCKVKQRSKAFARQN